MRPRSTCTRVMGREEYGEGKELLMILSIPPHQWSMVVVVSWLWACMAASGTGSLVFIDDVTADKRQQDEFWSVSGNIICSYSAKCFRNSWTALHSADGTMTQSILQKQPKSFEGKEVDCYAMAKSITWPESDWACISLAGDKTEGKCPKNKQELKTVCSRGLAEHHQGMKPSVWWCLCVPDFRLVMTAKDLQQVLTC